jgi:hypothetical protein
MCVNAQRLRADRNIIRARLRTKLLRSAEGDNRDRDLRLGFRVGERRPRLRLRRDLPPAIAGDSLPPLTGFALRFGDLARVPPCTVPLTEWMMDSYPAPKASLKWGMMAGSIGILFE